MLGTQIVLNNKLSFIIDMGVSCYLSKSMRLWQDNLLVQNLRPLWYLTMKLKYSDVSFRFINRTWKRFANISSKDFN